MSSSAPATCLNGHIIPLTVLYVTAYTTTGSLFSYNHQHIFSFTKRLLLGDPESSMAKSYKSSN